MWPAELAPAAAVKVGASRVSGRVRAALGPETRSCRGPVTRKPAAPSLLEPEAPRSPVRVEYGPQTVYQGLLSLTHREDRVQDSHLKRQVVVTGANFFVIYGAV